MRTPKGRVNMVRGGRVSPYTAGNRPIIEADLTKGADTSVVLANRTGSNPYATRSRTTRTYPHTTVVLNRWNN